MAKSSKRFWQIKAGFGAILALTAVGISWDYDWLEKRGHILVEESARAAKVFHGRHDWVFCTTFVLITTGTTTVLPSDFNTANNTIHAIGPGGGGAASQAGGVSGGGGGGGGAWASISNASCAASSTQNISVTGTASVWMRVDGGSGAPTTTAQGVLAIAGAAGSGGSGGAGGATGSCVGSSTNAGGGGGNGGVSCPSGGPGGGGGGAGGLNAAGTTATTCAGGQGDGTSGGAGGSGAVGGNGAEWTITAGGTAGSGGGGGGNQGIGTGFAGGKYGGGGGGGGNVGTTSVNAGGAGFQGCIVLQYVPAGGGGGPIVYPLRRVVRVTRIR